MASWIDRLMSHWLMALPVILLVAALGLRQIDIYPPDTDEFYSMYSAGWLIGGPFSPLEVIEYLDPCCSDHVPGYYYLLSAWGSLISYELASGRIFSVFCALLLIAVVYRLGRELMSPAAGLFAVIILASNAYANYYTAHLRMYPLLMLMSATALWLYLRILYAASTPLRRDCLALGAATLVLLSIHLFSLVFLLPLAVYHLVFAPRGSPWLALSKTGLAVALLSAPWLLPFILKARSAVHWQLDLEAITLSTPELLSTLAALASNGQPLLLLIGTAGLALALRRGRAFAKPIALLAALHLALIVIANEATAYIITSGFRYLLPSCLALLLAMAAGFAHLQGLRRLLGLLVALWLVAGIVFQANNEWRPHIAGRDKAYRLPAWHIIGRLAHSDPPPRIAGHFTSSIKSFSHNKRIPYSQRLHFFGPKDIPLSSFEDAADFADLAARHQRSEPRLWILYDETELGAFDIQALQSTMRGHDYHLCQRLPIGDTWLVLDYGWDILDCSQPEPRSAAGNQLLTHNFYRAALSDDKTRLAFVSGWQALEDFEHAAYALSYQLVSADWDNVAQLDLPLEHAGGMRRHEIDLAGVGPGSYRLMAVHYDKRSGQRLDWHDNDDYVPSMLPLAEITISE